MNVQESSGIVRFGVFEVDLEAGELRRNGTQVKLQEQPFQLLALLLERAGDIYSREDLRQRLWQEDTFVDFDRSLNTAVNKIRDALGDSAENPRFIQTVPRRGYRFICPVLGVASPAPTLVETPPAAGPSGTRVRLWQMATAIFLAGLAGAFVMNRLNRPPKAKLAIFTVPAPEKTTLGETAVSPDGSSIVFSVRELDGKRSLWIRSVDSISPHALPGTDGATSLFWSPDSRFIAFFARGGLYKVGASGGPVQLICEARDAAGGAWGSDGSVLFGRKLDSLARVPSAGGAPQSFTDLDMSKKESRHYWPSILPDNQHFLYVVTSTLPEVQGLWLASLTNPREKRRLLADVSRGVYSSGHLLFVRSGVLMAQPFDLRNLAVLGEAAPILDRVFSKSVGGYGLFSASVNGVLSAIAASRNWRFTSYDRKGNSQGAFGAQGRYQFVSLSPDQTRIAADAMSETEPNYRLFVLDRNRGTTAIVTTGAATGNFPVWSPDGSRLAFSSDREGVYNIYVRSSADVGEEELLFRSRENKFVSDWSRDGRYLIYAERVAGLTRQDLWVLPMFGDRKPVRYLPANTATLRDARFSPDGRWVAYSSDESSSTQIYVQSFPAGSSKIQISTAGGMQPRWRADGKELYYVAPDGELMAVEVKDNHSSEVGDPKPLFKTWIDNIEAGYEPSHDGQRFVMLAPEGDFASAPLTVILNWTEAIKP
jgi:Tol biopolymer transport system component/DNA-binding winged helix-turn-helix (wHTH) protein